MATKQQQAAASGLLLVCFLLLICMTGQAAARPEPTSSSTIDHKKHMLQGGGKTTTGATTVLDHMEKLQVQGQGMEQQEADMLKEYCDCHEEEDCLMRRTLVAHTDYIYTQGKHN